MSTRNIKGVLSRLNTEPSATKPDETKPRSWVTPPKVMSHTSSHWFKAVRTLSAMRKSKALQKIVRGERGKKVTKSRGTSDGPT